MKWVVIGKQHNDVVYLKITEEESLAKKYLEECQIFFGIGCKMELGEIYTIGGNKDE